MPTATAPSTKFHKEDVIGFLTEKVDPQAALTLAGTLLVYPHTEITKHLEANAKKLNPRQLSLLTGSVALIESIWFNAKLIHSTEIDKAVVKRCIMAEGVRDMDFTETIHFVYDLLQLAFDTFQVMEKVLLETAEEKCDATFADLIRHAGQHVVVTKCMMNQVKVFVNTYL